MTVFDFHMSRKRQGPLEFLGNFGGLLQTDAYAAYDGVGGPIVLCTGLLIAAGQPLYSQVCCVQPTSEYSVYDKVVTGDPGSVGEAFYGVLSETINFNGNWVGESTESPGANSCYWPQSSYPQHPGLSGGGNYGPGVIVSSWPIAGDEYGDDFLELNVNTLVKPIRQHFASQYAGTPGWACTITLYQQMNYSCTGEGGNYQAYWDNTINFVVYSNKIQFSRGSATATLNQ